MSLAVGEIQRLLAEADRHRDARRFASAAELYDRVVTVHPDRADLWVQLGNMLKDAGRHEAAERAYANALKRAPDVFDTHLQRARNSKLSGDREGALASLTRALKLAPASSEVIGELIHLGDSWTAARHSDLGPRLLSEVLDTVDALRRTLARIEDELPRIASLNVVPVERYDLYRRVYKVPAPPPSPALRIAVVMPAAADLDETLAILSAMRRQRHAQARLVVTGATDAAQSLIAAAAVETPDTFVMPEPPGDDDATEGERLLAAATALAETCDWLVLSGRPMILDPEALGWIAHAAATRDAAAIVCDEDCCEPGPGDTARHMAPQLRATPDPELLAQGIGLGSLLALPAGFVREQASARPLADTAAGAESCLATLAALAAETGTIVHLPQVLASRWASPSSPVAAYPAPRPASGTTISADAAAIEVVIPTRNRHELLDACITALEATCNRRDLLRVTVIDNGSDELACLAMFAAGQSSRRFRVLRMAEPFNWSRLNNQALAGDGDAPLVVFANNDIEMLSPGWDDTLRTLLARADVGVVGARLAYPDRTLQHAGIVTGFNGATEHEGRGADIDAPGPQGRWQTRRSVSAVTGAFLATRRATFADLAGFDAAALPIWFSDVDFSLKSWARNLRVLYEPAILALHHESKTLTTLFGADQRSAEYEAAAAVMRARWGARMADDPWLSPTYARLGAPTAYLRAPRAGWWADRSRLSGE